MADPLEECEYILLVECLIVICTNVIGLVVLTRINVRPRKLHLILMTALFTAYLLNGVNHTIIISLDMLVIKYPRKIGGYLIEFIFINQVSLLVT